MLRTLAVAAVAAALAAPHAASAAPPSPHSCTVKIEGASTPTDPANLVATGAVAVAAAEVVCAYDVVNTAPSTWLGGWSGHISMGIQDGAGNTFAGCANGPNPTDAIGPVLVLRTVQHCVIPVTDPRRRGDVYVRVDWATIQGGTYVCCASRTIRITPVGVL